MARSFASFFAVAALMLLGSVPAGAAMPILEEAAEVERLDAQVDSSGIGTITVRRCDQCDTETLRITASTRLYLGRDLLPLSSLRDHLGSGATVVFKPDSPEVVRIRLWSKPPGDRS